MAKEKCRLCLNEGILSNIFNTQSNPMISTKIMSLAKVEIYEDDGLPNTICFGCIEMLNKCFEFVQKIVASDLKLRTIYSNSNEDSEEADDKTSTDNDNHFLNDDIKFSPKSENLKKISIDENTNFATKQYFKENVPLKGECEKLNIKNNCRNLKDSGKKSHKEQCFTCGKVMSSRFRLKTHLRTHTGERPFSCPYCNKNFSLAQNLKVHIRVHTGEKPLQCKICGETFAQSAGLAAHKRKHTGQTPYCCTLCPRSFRTIGHLQYHIRRHTGEKNFECETCGRAFITRSDLKQHLLTHSGDRRHVCCVCGVRLTRASHLKRHIQNTHNGEKSFLCTQCPSKFTQKVDFEKHKKKHAKTEENT